MVSIRSTGCITILTSGWPNQLTSSYCISDSHMSLVLVRVLGPVFLCVTLGLTTTSLAVIRSNRIILCPALPNIIFCASLALIEVTIGHLAVLVVFSEGLFSPTFEAHFHIRSCAGTYDLLANQSGQKEGLRRTIQLQLVEPFLAWLV